MRRPEAPEPVNNLSGHHTQVLRDRRRFQALEEPAGQRRHRVSVTFEMFLGASVSRPLRRAR